MSRLSIKAKVMLLVATSAVSLVGVASIALTTLDSVEVASEAREEVLESERLVADVLPPTASLVEGYLTVQQLVNETDPAEVTRLRERLVQLEVDFTERHAFYLEAVTGADLAEALEDSYQPGLRFWQLVDTDLLPALDTDEIKAARGLARDEINEAYDEHRLAADRVVALATQARQQAEARATEGVESRSSLLALTVILATIVTGFVGAVLVASIVRSLRRFRKTARVTLPALVERIRETGDASMAGDELRVEGNGELGEATRAFDAVIVEAVEIAKNQSELRRTTQANLVTLARRSQNLLYRQLQLIEKVEQVEDDPDTLDLLFKIDHLATRMRRNAESLLVLADRPQLRKPRDPLALDEVLRIATSAIEQYQRVRLCDGDDVDVDGQYAPELVHLFAELLENAVRFSSPETDVSVSVRRGDTGCTVRVSDVGIDLADEELAEANRRLAGVAELGEPTYLGHLVVGRLATRLGAQVHLEHRSSCSGVVAVVELPSEVLALSEAASEPPEAVSEPPEAVSEPPDPVPAEAALEVAPLLTPFEQLPDLTVADDASELATLVEAVAPPAGPIAASAPISSDATDVFAPADPAGLPTLTAESFGLRKRQAGSSLAKTARQSDHAAQPASTRNAESVRDRFSSFSAGKRQARTAGDLAAAPTDQESS